MTADALNAPLTLLNPAEWTEASAADVNARLESASAAHIADWAVATFGTQLIVAASMQDTILPHMFGTRLPGVEVLFLETGYHFPETLATRDEAARRLPITVVNALPQQTVARAGRPVRCAASRPRPQLVLRAPQSRAAQARPSRAAHAWVTGARRTDAITRVALPVVQWDAKHGLVKINPLALWSDEQVEAYQATHDLPRHPLVAQGYPSIGCAPCTRAVAPGEDPRAGRWAGQGKTECGIHE